MFLLWMFLGGLYGIDAIRLSTQGEWGGALIVLAIAVLFAFLCRRSYYKRKMKQQKKRLP